MSRSRYLGPLLGSTLAVIALGKCAHMKYEDVQYEARLKAEKLHEEQKLASSLRQLANQHGANANWAMQLALGKTHRHSPILTAELQDLWVRPTPMLFIGVLRDLAKNSDGTYVVVLHYEDGSEGYYLPLEQLHVEARCSHETAQPLLNLAKSKQRRSYLPDAAIVVRVQEARKEHVKLPDGTYEDRAIATGDCIEAVALQSRLPRNWLAMPAN